MRVTKINGSIFFCSRAYISNALRARGITPDKVERNKHDETRLVYMYIVTDQLIEALNSIDPELRFEVV